MQLFNFRGKIVKKDVFKYLIDWEKESCSKFQSNVKKFLKNHWINHVVFEEFPVFGTRMRVDFFNATKFIAIEAHGDQHNQYNKFFYNNDTSFAKSIIRDNHKIQWLKLNNIKLIEIYQSEIDLLSVEYIYEKYKIKL